MSVCSLRSTSRLAILTACAVVGAMAGQTALAQVKITEIWPNGDTGLTSDWFELTNIGPLAIDPSGYYYDDSHGDPGGEQANLTGITNLDPGESAIYLISWHDFYPDDPAGAVAAFDAIWQPNGAYQVGYILQPETPDPPNLPLPGEGGHGLSGTGGDTVNVYDGPFPLALLASESYTGSADISATWVVNPATNAVQFASVGFDGGFVAASGTPIGSPGKYNVPEPTTIALTVLGMLGVFCARRRR